MKAHGVSKAVAELVIVRDSATCVVQVTHPGLARASEQIHHRMPRGMGGTRDPQVNQAPNLVCVCAPCHTYLESHRTEAADNGWLIRGVLRPATSPLLYRGRWMYLSAEGRVVQFLKTPWED